LRHKGDDAFTKIPDTNTLPDRPWIPVLIRCRDIGEPRGRAALVQAFNSEDESIRYSAVRAYAHYRDTLDGRLLSYDFGGVSHWLDPRVSITEAQIARASIEIGITPEQVRSRYEAMAADLSLKLNWRH